jgi:predicted Zn-dependent peptidase
MFEQEDGTDPFEYYSERGADANANTSNYKTTYLFSGPEFFDENINYLIDYVQSPYFTDENVEKEKGIIIQEIKMYQDDPYSVLFEKSVYNSFIKHPIKIPVIGTIESVKKITKKDLYECYNTFYNPGNMFIVVTGNIDPKQTIELIKENQSKKEFKKIDKIKLKKYEEPDNVEKLKEIIKMDITKPKVTLNYKINYEKLGLNLRDAQSYLTLITDINIGTTSLLNEKLRNDQVITNNIEYTFISTDKHILLSIMGESDNTDLLLKELENQMNNLSISEEDFKRKKKNYASSCIFMSDNIFSMNSKIMSNIIKYNKVNIDDVKYTKDLDYDKANSIIKELDLSNKSIVIINPKETN